ncbi:uncharacterized protein FOMMEDRAFT_75436 [Fomitiporia mediterranea MF3/22]|uniref:uncharacterized protein n=1 Tax=Fomitiporia mediterranea (strain MF3/22) TaxID=694068 RepID=UPI0004407638|nr:uncharacterized protein FOMMEDRAFT_75436 [Fomitiporia mediterranea MF3/22]EJD06996.1 hypothetical protein FOMMEDRAFT_75436 [Fomitiporia mediterranea MF3/22]
MPVNHARHRVMALYKELHRLGRDYPDPSYDFHGKLRKMFEKNKELSNPEDIEKALQFGEFIRNETLALIRLSKYRHLKRAYPPLAEPPPDRPPPT